MTHKNAIITASYAPDFERCKILCESIDRFVTGFEYHYLLVDTNDLTLFKQLEGPNRKVISERDLLPWWMVRLPILLSPGKRRLWVSPLTVPLHGWHTQQLKRIAVAKLITEEGLLYCDSDTAFVKPFDVSDIWIDDDIRFWREDGGALQSQSDHLIWKAHAERVFGIKNANQVSHNYVHSPVVWRRQTVLEMCDFIEKLHGRPWVSVIGSTRKFSECMLYGAYVDCVINGKGHYANEKPMSQMCWFDPAPTEDELRAIVANLSADQVAVGVQSFIPYDLKIFRRVVLGENN